MTSRNHLILTGKVATPPRFQYRPDGSPVVQFPLEFNNLDDPSGQSLTHAVSGYTGRGRINVVAFGELAESKRDLLQKDSYLLVEGRLNQRQWQTPEGKKQTQTEVIAIDLQLMENTDQTACLPTRKLGSIKKRGEEDEKTC